MDCSKQIYECSFMIRQKVEKHECPLSAEFIICTYVVLTNYYCYVV